MRVYHKTLTDKQYRFCEFYVFGLPLDNIKSLASCMFKNYIDASHLQDFKHRALEYRNPENSLKYCFDNATGSYYKAFGCSYNSAKACANRLLKNYYIKQELSFMYEFLKRTGYSRLEAKRYYISPNTNLYDIKHNKEDRARFIKLWHLEDLVK